MITGDLVFDILVRLPGKPLLRFRCVSKSWRRIIADPSFKATYHSRLATKTNPEYLLQLRCQPPSMCSISRCNESFVEQEVLQIPVSSLNHPNMTITGSCNGLLCLAASDDTGRSFGDEIYLLNPAIRRLKLLPPSPVQPDRRWDLPPNSKWHPNPNHVGIGFNSLTADYKVVKIGNILTTSPEYRWFTGAQIYSLRSNSWKTVTYFNSGIDIWGSCSGPFLNGAFYWLAKKESGRHDMSNLSLWLSFGIHQWSWKDLFILSFDFAGETFKEMRLPESLSDEGRNFLLTGSFCMGEFNGKLYLMLNKNVNFEIWLMMEESSWVKTFCEPSYGGTFLNTTPLGFGMNNEMILLKPVRNWDNAPKNIVAYDPDTGTVVDHGTREASKLFHYVPSLALLGEESLSFEEALA
ncbi:hypothetical protein SLA2020_386320 [Shorea laevis]